MDFHVALQQLRPWPVRYNLPDSGLVETHTTRHGQWNMSEERKEGRVGCAPGRYTCRPAVVVRVQAGGADVRGRKSIEWALGSLMERTRDRGGTDGRPAGQLFFLEPSQKRKSAQSGRGWWIWRRRGWLVGGRTPVGRINPSPRGCPWSGDRGDWHDSVDLEGPLDLVETASCKKGWRDGHCRGLIVGLHSVGRKLIDIPHWDGHEREVGWLQGGLAQD